MGLLLKSRPARMPCLSGFSAQAITGLQDYTPNYAPSLRRARFFFIYCFIYYYIQISIYINKCVYK